MADGTGKKPRISLSTAIIISLILGITTGIFLGEPAARLQPLGDAFIRLLQMTILPYIVLSLVSGLGGLSFAEAKLLALRGGAVMLLFWAASFLVILLMPLTFPAWESASFYSTSVVTPRAPVDFVGLYIPANPVESMADNIIPAVVVFCSAIGVALIGIKEKDVLIAPIKVLTTALTRIAGYVVYLTPIGVFAIAASASGTMTVDEFGRLQVYFVTFIVGTMVLTFWLLPMLVMAFTPFRYRDIVGICRDAMVTGFTTGNLFIILPLLIENCKQLFEQYQLEEVDTDNYVDVIIPVSFNFPNTGKLLILLFVLFAGWFSGNPLGLGDYPNFVVTGLFSFFGGVDLALPFLLDIMDIPADLYQLYLVTGIINGRFATLLGVMNLLTFTLAATCAVMGIWKVNWRQILIYAGISVGIMAAMVIGTRLYLSFAVSNEYTKDKVIANMQLLDRESTARVLTEVPEERSVKAADQSRLAAIGERGVLRVGYRKDNLPWTYFNANGDLVGFDVELAYDLATTLHVGLEFVPVELNNMARLLDEGVVDVVLSGVAILPDRLEEMRFTDSYLDVSLALVVRDSRRREFSSLDAIRERDDLRIGLPGGSEYLYAAVQKGLPKANIVKLSSVQEFFEQNIREVDALLTSAEAGSSWTLIYPEYDVVVPKPRIIGQPVGMALDRDSIELLVYLNGWIDVMTKNGRIELIRNYWILGIGAEDTGPRWSVIRNVLGWVD